MKRIRTAFIVLMIAFFSSCQTPIDNYKGSIVIEKMGNTPYGYKMVIQKKQKA